MMTFKTQDSMVARQENSPAQAHETNGSYLRENSIEQKHQIYELEEENSAVQVNEASNIIAIL